MFNTFIWELYRESERGKRALGRCSRFSDALHDSSYLTLFFGLSLAGDVTEYPATDSDSIEFICTVRDYAAQTKVDNLDGATALFEALAVTGLHVHFSGNDEATRLTSEYLAAEIQRISIGLHLAHPEHFIPYGFVTSFDFLQRISETFNLALPSVPGKKDMEGRGRYYAQLNVAFHQFRHTYAMSTVEMCAFLYDFAPRSLSEDDNELPEPSKVWPIIAGAYYEDDHDWLEQATEKSQNPFSGHPDMRRGDVLLVYGVSRHKKLSFISHIGRAMLDGFKDPFCYFYDVVWLGQLTPVAPVTFKELRAHPKLSQSAAVRTHMKGPGSGSFTLGEYDAILSIMASKGQDIALLPRPLAVSFLPSTELLTERDVETALIEPLLLRLGYAETDWLRQLRVRMGRGERVFPDYVFGAQTVPGEERAEMVLEAKFSIAGDRAFRETYVQATSYAYRLRAEVLLASREGLWLFEQQRGSFALGRSCFYNWEGLQHPDTLSKLKTSLVRSRR